MLDQITSLERQLIALDNEKKQLLVRNSAWIKSFERKLFCLGKSWILENE